MGRFWFFTYPLNDGARWGAHVEIRRHRNEAEEPVDDYVAKTEAAAKRWCERWARREAAALLKGAKR